MNRKERKLPVNRFAFCIFAILLLSLFAGCTNNNQPSKPNKPPSAIITSPLNNATYEVGQEIIFNGLESKDPEGKPVIFSWSLGDGTIKKEGEFTYTYSTARTYEIVLGTTDGKKTNSTKIKIIVKEANRAPEPYFVYENNFTRVGVPIWFNASLTTDPDGNVLNYTWYFGDGSSVNGVNLTNVSHAYSKPGIYTVSLLADDGRLAKNTTCEITVFGEIDILVDWNKTEYNYVLNVEGPLNSSHLSANVKDETSNAVWTANIEDVEISGGNVSCKLKTSLVPSAGHSLSVNVLYFGHDLTSRHINVSGENIAPFGNYEIGYEITINSTKNGRKTEFMNLTGLGAMNITGNTAQMSICANGTLYSYEKTENNGTKVLDAEIKNGTFLECYQNGTKLHHESDMHFSGTMIERDSEGNESFTAKLGMNTTVRDEMIVNTSSFLYGIVNGDTPFYMNITAETIGNGTHANASGIEYECLKILEIQTMDAIMNINNETWHVRAINNSIKWIC
ncbi:MAG: PKD domain-containing protein, partial [Thermoplasmata archaeon]